MKSPQPEATTRSAEFMPLSTPLSKGVTRIEANAGTGKTYTLENLAVRLVNEAGLEARQLLVLTFSNKAAAELRQRIHQNFEKKAQEEAAQPDSVNRVAIALEHFDEMTISTFHSFFQSILSELGVFGGVLPETEIMEDPAPLLLEIAHQFMRQIAYNGLLGASYFVECFGTHEKLANEILNDFIKYPRLQVSHPHQTLDGLLKSIANTHEHLRHCKAQLAEEKESILCFFDDPAKIVKKSFNKRSWEKMNRLLGDLEQCKHLFDPKRFGEGTNDFGALLPDALSGKLQEGVTHSFGLFDALGKLRSLLFELQDKALSYLHTLLHDELPKLAKERRVKTFDILQTEAFSLMQSKLKPGAADALRERYKAVLLDEFQDTDGLQNDFITQIFQPDDTYLYFVGDPKQSIYRFRGADLFAYARTAAESAKKFTLTSNWRSSSKLIEAVNRIFGASSGTFVYQHLLEYTDSRLPAEKATAKEPLQADGVFQDGLRIKVLTEDSDKKNKGSIETEVLELTARRVFETLEAGRNAIRPKDLVVLVRRKAEGHQMELLLQSMGIPARMQTKQKLFSTDEARELYMLLSCLLSAGQASSLPTAMSCGLLGRKVQDALAVADAGSEVARKAASDFFKAREVWLEKGIYQAILCLDKVYGIAEHCLRQVHGKVLWQNIEKIALTLHQVEKADTLSARALLNRFGKLCNGTSKTSEASALATQDLSDDAVSIMTIHASKGLEFPAVFIPLLSKKPRYSLIKIFHDPANNFQPAMVRPQDKENYDIELQAEERRLLYVALTRAKHSCEVLIHSTFTEYVELLSAGAGKDGGIEQVRPEPLDIQAMQYRCEREVSLVEPKKIILQEYDHKGRYSFTALARLKEPDIESTTVLDTPPEKSPAAQPTTVLPAGAAFGSLLHEVLERVSFDWESDAEQNLALIAELAKKQGYTDEQTDELAALARHIAEARLPFGDSIVRLADVPPQLKIKEMMFSFEMGDIDWDALKARLAERADDAFAQGLLKSIKDISTFPSGLLSGYIDLIFEHGGKLYILDWKSNLLGAAPSAFTQTAMEDAMRHHSYHLQLYLYSVATERYFASRMKSDGFPQIFGGVIYLFIRGLQDNQDTGVFYTPPASILPLLTA